MSPSLSQQQHSNYSRAIQARNTVITLPLPVPSTPLRAASSIFGRRVKVSRIAKVALGTIIASLGLVATWIALDVAMWTAVKEWRDDCRDQKANNIMVSARCAEILSQELVPPPTWRSFLSRLPDPMKGSYSKLEDRDDSAFEEHDGDMERGHDELYTPATSSVAGVLLPRTTQASMSGRPVEYERMLNDLIADYAIEPSSDLDDRITLDSIRKQSDNAIIYGGECRYQATLARFFYRHGSRVLNISRINPIPAPRWWEDDELETAWMRGTEQWFDLDWEGLSDHLSSCGRVSATRSGYGSFEYMVVSVGDWDDPFACSCSQRRRRTPVRNVYIGMGPVTLWDGPSWLFWENVRSGLAVILMYPCFAWVFGLLRRRQRDKRDKREHTAKTHKTTQ